MHTVPSQTIRACFGLPRIPELLTSGTAKTHAEKTNLTDKAPRIARICEVVWFQIDGLDVMLGFDATGLGHNPEEMGMTSRQC